MEIQKYQYIKNRVLSLQHGGDFNPLRF